MILSVRGFLDWLREKERIRSINKFREGSECVIKKGKNNGRRV